MGTTRLLIPSKTKAAGPQRGGVFGWTVGLFAAASMLAMLVAGCGSGAEEISSQADQVATELSSATVAEPAATTSLAPTTSAGSAALAPAESTERSVMVAEVEPADSTDSSQPSAAGQAGDSTTSSSVPPTTAAPSTAAPVEAETPTSVAQIADSARDLVDQNWSVMATYAEVTLLHPSNRVERVGFHESNHDGARQMEPAATAVNPMVLESRERGTGSRTAADVVVEPETEIRAPVTGTVIRAGGYILYCKHNDDFVVIEPDSHPGWEVKVLHISGLMVGKGDRVEAGVTVLAPAATPLPFDSQVDEFTAEPSWPHVHIELVDPSIPDRPSPGGGGGC